MDSRSSDIWAIGYILYQMLTVDLLFTSIEESDAVKTSGEDNKEPVPVAM